MFKFIFILEISRAGFPGNGLFTFWKPMPKPSPLLRLSTRFCITQACCPKAESAAFTAPSPAVRRAG